jgi:hypothetical protein
MVPTAFIRIRSLHRPRRVRGGGTSHPDSVSEASLKLPRRIDDPTSAAQLTRVLLPNHREDITMASYLDDRHRLVGTAILTGGWVQADDVRPALPNHGQGVLPVSVQTAVPLTDVNPRGIGGMAYPGSSKA